ncbi:hypothetical protein [Microvirga sp. KLBC 81]|uniref:hypothetical protein n=1 Tax=Microvirga sp. KLBC 81 TaxID=1862707 RepID=UPI001057E919|nr:hypothetical protein [Microvirga sp. KLBC 81]
MTPNREVFRAFLKFGSPQKTGVTGVTGVTVNKINNLPGHTAEKESVTGVTEIAGYIPASSDLDERQAIAEVEGGIPPLYSAGFARLQLTPPPGLSVPQWLEAVDDAGRFLDAFGQQAQAIGWRADDLFRPDGLVQTLQGAHVNKITTTTAVRSDGRIFKGVVSE